jgi:hypothetical protein
MILNQTVLPRIVLDKICLIFLYDTYVNQKTHSTAPYLRRAPRLYGWVDTEQIKPR